MKRVTAAGFAAVLAWAPFEASEAQFLYKWIDAQGRTQYSDRMPKDAKGPVTRIEVDERATPTPRATRGAGNPPSPAVKEELGSPPDLNSRRRETRARLRADLDRAQASLDAARKALADGGESQVGERQVIQQRVDAGGNPNSLPLPNTDPTQSARAGGGMHGMTKRSNCRQVAGPDGKPRVICPTMVPGPDYFDRVRRLEEAVKRAEEELAAAEGAYRRGTD